MTALRLAFTAPAGVAVRDAVGGWDVDDGGDAVPTRSLELATGAGWGLDQPAAVVATPTGEGLDVVGDLTIVMLARIDVAAAASSSGVTVIQLVGHGAASPLWQLLLIVLDPAARLARLTLRHHDGAGGWGYLDGPAYVVPDGSHLVACSRERFATGYRASWAIDDEPAGTSPAIGLAIADPPGTAADVEIWSGAGGVACAGVLEYLEIQPRAAAPEELELLGRRLAELTPKVERALRAQLPAGVYSRDPSSIIQRELRVEAAILARARAELETIGTYGGPLRSFGETLEQWEATLEAPAGAGDGIVERRARLARHLAARAASAEQLRAELAAALGSTYALDQPTAVEFVDGFDTPTTSGGYLTGGHDAAAWIQAGSGYTFTRTGSVYRLSRTLAATDLRYRGRTLQGDAHPPMLIHPDDGGPDTVWRTRLSAFTVPADNVLAGLVIGDAEADDWTWIGIVRVSSTYYLKAARYVGEDPAAAITARHLGPAAWTAIATFGGSFAATSIRVRETSTPGTWSIQHTTAADPGDDWTAIAAGVELAGLTPRPRWAGPALVGLGSSVTGAVSADWEFYAARTPNAPWALTGHAYRDPADPGGYDLAAAQQAIDRLGPAHLDITAIDRRRSLVYGDATTLLDRDPVGT